MTMSTRLAALLGLPQATPRRTIPEILAQLCLHRSEMYADGHSGLPPVRRGRCPYERKVLWVVSAAADIIIEKNESQENS